MSDRVIEAVNVVKSLGDGARKVQALKRVNLHLAGGELVLLMGPSGSGKTTLLSVLGCILSPNEGTVRICGQSTSGLQPEALAKLRLAHIGFVFQTYHLFPTLTAIDNVRLVLEVAGERPHHAAVKAMDVLALIGLAHKARALPLELSSGEQQRVAIARAMVGNAAVILADEPTAALDSENGHSVMSLLAEVAKIQSRGVLVVTHDARTLPFANRVVRIDDGRIVGEEQGAGGSPGPTRRSDCRVMKRLRRHASVLAILRAVGVTAMILGTAWPIGSQETIGSPNGDKGAGWQAVAPGLVEPVSGEIKIMVPVVGRISRVAVAVDDKVVAGEPVLHLDDEEARARVATARAQIAMRERVRNDQSAGKGENRRNAEDDVADAEETLINARAAFDVAALAKRDGSGSDAAVATAHAAWMRAQENIDRQRARLRKLESESGTPLPTQKEGDLQVARSELELAVAQLEKLTIRSPIAGTVLQVNVKAGEVAAPTASQPLILLGDVSRLRVRAELDEHDVGKVAAGGSVVVRANAFRGREFAGKVSAIAPIVRLGRISSPASGHLTDFSVNEILIELDDPGPLLVGMKVDVYFRAPK